MTRLETRARIEWMGWGGHAKYTHCDHCWEWLYCRSKDGKRFVCLGCFDQGHR
jgi:hypothetical protein